LTQPLPNSRAELLALHAEARRRRDRSGLGGPEFREVCEEIAAIEVQIARIERPQPALPATPSAPATGA
jgi:hypothetical protein